MRNPLNNIVDYTTFKSFLWPNSKLNSIWDRDFILIILTFKSYRLFSFSDKNQ